MVDPEKINKTRRKWLIAGSSVVGLAATGAYVTPLLASWQPSAKAKSIGAPIEMDFTKLPDGAQQKGLWRGKAIFVLRMTEAMHEAVAKTLSDGLLLDPTSETDVLPASMDGKRQIRKDIMVQIGICTHLGCAPILQDAEEGQAHTAGWVGGYFCPCHGSLYDYTGRVYKNVPAPRNLDIPPYYFKSDNLVVIGEEAKA